MQYVKLTSSQWMQDDLAKDINTLLCFKAVQRTQESLSGLTVHRLIKCSHNVGDGGYPFWHWFIKHHKDAAVIVLFPCCNSGSSFRTTFYILVLHSEWSKNISPLWPCCDSSCFQRCTWRSRWPVWSQVTPQKRLRLCWCFGDSADASSSQGLGFLGFPSHAGKGKGISCRYSLPRSRAYSHRTPHS